MSASQSRLDALADAETLTLYAVCHCDNRTPTRKLAGLWRYTDPDSLKSRSDVAVYHTIRAAAHHAFRAVPGLRGEP